MHRRHGTLEERVVSRLLGRECMSCALHNPRDLYLHHRQPRFVYLVKQFPHLHKYLNKYTNSININQEMLPNILFISVIE